ncbi:MAG: glycosyltransferase, partial [Acetobacteraceae bacterium]|nr:glycosyltransferase [Acetobacteraceae bacterium]
GVGLATTLYTGLPSQGSIAARLGATQITHVLLPGALLARALGREDSLGATMALRRETLERAGGLAALVNHLADDNVLGRRVRALGLRVALAASVPATTVAESDLPALWRHELRWARTIRALAPAQFGASVLQYPLVWSAGAVLVSRTAPWSVVLFGLAWLIRAIVARRIDRLLGLAIQAPVWLLPLRELLSVAVLIASFLSDRVEWRGHALVADDGQTAQMPVSPKRG